jgi:hypothetical protein
MFSLHQRHKRSQQEAPDAYQICQVNVVQLAVPASCSSSRSTVHPLHSVPHLPGSLRNKKTVHDHWNVVVLYNWIRERVDTHDVGPSNALYGTSI